MAEGQLSERVVRPRLSFRAVAVISLVAILALVSACVSVLLDSRHELIRHADMMANNVLLLADQTVQIEVGRYDLRMLDIIADLHDTAGAEGGAMPTADALFGGASLRNSLGDIMVADARGAVLTSSRPSLTPQYVAALPQILKAPGSGPNGMSVSIVPLGGEEPPLVALIRRCLPGACGPATAIVSMLPMSWIQAIFNGIALGSNGAISLVDSNGILLAREPARPSRLGHLVERHQIISKLPRFCTVLTERRSITDGIDRRIAEGWVGGLPLIVFVGISTTDILRAWTALAAVTGFALVLLSGGLIALAIVLARQIRRKTTVDRQLLSANARLAELAQTDPLTGLLNRRGFDDTLAREWRRCRRARKPICLLMLDADRFKQYNDHFGHQAGDGVLRALSDSILTAIRRPGDSAARYGGEEFSIVLPDTDGQAGFGIAETIRTRFEALGLCHWPAGTVVTVSIGVSCAEPDASGTAEELLAAADAALYESKALGRNRVTARRVTPQPAAEQART